MTAIPKLTAFAGVGEIDYPKSWSKIPAIQRTGLIVDWMKALEREFEHCAVMFVCENKRAEQKRKSAKKPKIK